MDIHNLADEVVLKQLGANMTEHRLQKNMTQQALAKEAGVSLPTVQRIENGASTQLSNLIRILRALKLLENFEALVPELPPSPVAQLAHKGKIRKRASSKKQDEAEGDASWTWGDVA